MKTKSDLFRFLNHYRKHLFCAIILIFISETLKHLFETYKGKLVNEIIADTAIHSNLPHTVLIFVLIMIGIPFSFFLYTRIFYAFQARSLQDLRRNIFQGILRHSYPSFLKKNEGHYSNAYINEVNGLEMTYFNSIYGLLEIIAAVSSAMFFLYHIAPQLILFSIISIIPALLLPKFIGKHIVAYEKSAIYANENNIAKLNEFLDGIETIVNFGMKKRFFQKFEHSTQNYYLKRTRWFAAMSASFRISEIILVICNIISILFVAQFVGNGTLNAGDYIAALGIMNNLSYQIPYTTFYLQQLKSAKEKLRYIHNIADYKELSEQGRICIKNVHDLCFNNVHFHYPGTSNALFTNLNIYISGNGITQISGQSGSGKTTLSSLLLGYYPVDSGTVSINNVSVQEISNINDLISIMRQENFFFDATLKENLTMFREIPDNKVISLMQCLGLHKYANQHVLHASIGKYSDGEAKRMMLLRAIIHNKPITILDEPLANLDNESIHFVENVLSKIDDKMIIIISHQPLNIKLKEKIIIEHDDTLKTT